MWLFDIPMWVGLPVFVILGVAVSCGVVLLLRSWVRRASGAGAEWDRVLSYAVGAYGIFYGVTLGLIAAASYGNFAEVDSVVLEESSAVAVLYRTAELLPDPVSGDVQASLVDYTNAVVEEDWPLQERLIEPTTTDDMLTGIQNAFADFEPRTAAENTYLAQTVNVYNDLVERRRDRISLTELALPGVLWIVLGVGAVLNAVLIALIEVRSLRIHLIMASMIATFVALLLYAVAGFDHAYAGPIAVGPGYFEALLTGLLSGG